MSNPTETSPSSRFLGRWRTIATAACLIAASLAYSTPANAATTVSVYSFGATGDGSTNDRQAIQDAIDAVAATGGGTVTLPGGTATNPAVFLAGNLVLDSHVTLEIADNAVLKQSQNTADYANTPALGRVIPGSTIAFITYLDQNYPFIYAGNATDVHIAGDGEIALTRNGGDSTSILTHGVGMFEVSNYSIKDVTISGASAYNITVRSTEGGEISGVTTTAPATLNSDGISIMNSSNLVVRNNDLTTLDDGIYIWASYDDPRRSAWWNSDTPTRSDNIEIYQNVVDNQATNGSHGFLFINWTAAAPDKSAVEVSRINVHDNSFTATYAIGALNQDIYHASIGDKTPSKWLRFVDNDLYITPGSGGSLSNGLSGMATTDLESDDPSVYNFSTSSNVTGLYNSNFDGGNAWPTQVGLSFWSTEGATVSLTGGPTARFAEVPSYSTGYASVTQGIYLAAGTYSMTADIQTTGAPFRLLAVQATPLVTVASSTTSATMWTTETLNFTVTSPGNYRIGLDNVGSGWGVSDTAKVDNVTLTKTS